MIQDNERDALCRMFCAFCRRTLLNARTGGDVKSVQGDTGHAEAEMVTDVYSEIVDQDRRRNAQKMESDFYGGGDPSSDEEILRLLRGLPPERVKQLLAGIGGD